MQIERLTFSEWEDALPVTGSTWAHSPEVLRVLADHVTGELRLYGGFNGQQPIGLLPVVVRNEWFATAVISPPPGFGIPKMGPILMPTSPKQRKQMKVNREFTEAILDTVAAHDAFTLVGMSCSTEYADPRPYIWAGFDVETLFTYRVDLDATTPERVLQSFSRNTRRGIRDAKNENFTVALRGIERARDVYTAHKTRLNEQGADYPVSWEYTRDLVAALGDNARVYVAETADEQFISGITVVYSDDEGYAFQGGTRTGNQDASANTLLHWRVIEDILTDPALASINRYDLGNANIESLAQYKSKYNTELVPHYLIKSGKLMGFVQKAYELTAY
jgi:lipid II:glycine glycyltransferase (peptidoglycan interpeptide bridge formation enzyme)